MDNFFRKLTNKKVNYKLDTTKLLNRYGITLNDNFIGVSYYAVETSIEKKLLKQIFYPDARKHFNVSLMVINNSYIPPHIDNDLKMVMNLYIKTADAMTYFWTPKLSEITSIQLEMQSDGRLFKEEELECMGSFRAETYDLWMLNVSKIHSVRCESEELRIAYCFQSTTLSFEDAIKKLDRILL